MQRSPTKKQSQTRRKKSKVYSENIKKHERINQTIKTIEELSALQHALCRHLIILNRSSILDLKRYSEFVCEEIADVKIVLAQLEMFYSKSTIDEWMDYKLKRLEKSLK